MKVRYSFMLRKFYAEEDIKMFVILHLQGSRKLARQEQLDGKAISARINLPKNRLWILVFVKVNRTATLFFCEFSIKFCVEQRKAKYIELHQV